MKFQNLMKGNVSPYFRSFAKGMYQLDTIPLPNKSPTYVNAYFSGICIFRSINIKYPVLLQDPGI